MPLPKPWDASLSLPLIAAPMFLASGPELVTACCEQGVLGTMPALNARTTEDLDRWLTGLEARRAAHPAGGPWPLAPYGVNLIVHRTNPRLEADLAVLERHRVPLVITSLGAVSELVTRVHAWGGRVFHDVTNAAHARKAAAAGVDGIICVAAGAGGHAGTLNPFALLGEVRQVFDGTLVLAGCLSTGRDVLAARAMGADLAYMGTRFIATHEARADAAYKQMVVDSYAADVVYTPAVSGIPASFLKASLERAGYDLSQLSRPGELNYGEKLKPVSDEAKAWKTVWSAGQGVANIHDVVGTAELCARMREEYRAAREALLG
jgi:nitronate monooxygenase